MYNLTHRSMRGSQKVLSLATFHYTFGWENVAGLSSGFLLVFLKIYCRLFVYFARFTHTQAHTHTNNHFTALLDFVCDYLGEPTFNIFKKFGCTLWLILTKSAIMQL